jgi:hypothetical protein
MVDVVIPHYVVQTFTDVNGALVPDVPLDASSASDAASYALAFQACKAGVIAFEWSEEMRHGRYESPYILARFGRVPDECAAWRPADREEERTPRKPYVKRQP